MEPSGPADAVGAAAGAGADEPPGADAAAAAASAISPSSEALALLPVRMCPAAPSPACSLTECPRRWGCPIGGVTPDGDAPPPSSPLLPPWPVPGRDASAPLEPSPSPSEGTTSASRAVTSPRSASSSISGASRLSSSASPSSLDRWSKVSAASWKAATPSAVDTSINEPSNGEACGGAKAQVSRCTPCDRSRHGSSRSRGTGGPATPAQVAPPPTQAHAVSTRTCRGSGGALPGRHAQRCEVRRQRGEAGNIGETCAHRCASNPMLVAVVAAARGCAIAPPNHPRTSATSAATGSATAVGKRTVGSRVFAACPAG